MSDFIGEAVSTSPKRKIYNQQHLMSAVFSQIDQPIKSGHEALNVLNSLSLPNLRAVHDQLSLSIWNSEPFNIENRDKMVKSFGGIMYGYPHFYTRTAEPLVDIVSQKTIVESFEPKGYTSMHFIPLGAAHKIAGLEVPTSSLIILDLKRLIESFSINGSGATDRDIFYFDTNYQMARYLQTHLGFYVEKIFDDFRTLPAVFTSWEDVKKLEKPTIRMFITKDQLLNSVHNKVENAYKKVSKLAKIYNLTIDDYESALRKFAINALAYIKSLPTDEDFIKLRAAVK